MEEFLWVEKYRPKTVDDCILPERLKTVFKSYVTSGNIPNLLLTGSAGVGKTTVAKAMCSEMGINHMFINSSDERGIDTLRNKIKNYASTISLVGGRKVIILDEADYLTPEAQAALRGAIEEFSENCSFIFTCNFKTRIMPALHSRSSVIDFTLQKGERPEMAVQLQKRLVEILTKEGVGYDRQALQLIVQKFFPDYRRIINELQRYAGLGSISNDNVSVLNDATNLNDLFKALKEKDFTSMRKWVVANSDAEPAKLYRKVYMALYDLLKPETTPAVVLLIAKYQYQSAFVPDQEINTVACLTEIMVEGEFK